MGMHATQLLVFTLNRKKKKKGKSIFDTWKTFSSKIGYLTKLKKLSLIIYNKFGSDLRG